MGPIDVRHMRIVDDEMFRCVLVRSEHIQQCVCVGRDQHLLVQDE